jgi:protein SCO1/2
MSGSKPTTELAFPAEAIRTSFAPPRLELEDQSGAHVSLDALRGKVVVLTGVYASCSLTCPMIMAQTRRVYYSVPEELRSSVVVVAVTLDPEHDDRARRAEMAKAQGLVAPAFRLVGGAPADVNEVLDGLSIMRKRDPATGIIDHTNVFAVVDKKGRLAYRFTLGTEQEKWLSQALVQLAKE